MCFGAPQMPEPPKPPPAPPAPPPPLPQTPKPMSTEVSASKTVTRDEGATLQRKEEDAALKAKKKKGTAALRKQAPVDGAPTTGLNVQGSMTPSGGSLNIQRQ